MTNSDYFRQVVIFDIVKQIRAECVEVVINEPSIEDNRVVNNIVEFKVNTDGILANLPYIRG